MGAWQIKGEVGFSRETSYQTKGGGWREARRRRTLGGGSPVTYGIVMRTGRGFGTTTTSGWGGRMGR